MIEAAREADRAAVVALWRDCGLTRPWNDPDADFARALASGASAVLVARGAPKLQLMVREDNADALGFYAALGLERQSVATLGRFL